MMHPVPQVKVHMYTSNWPLIMKTICLEGTQDRVVQYVYWDTGQDGPICLLGTLDRVVQYVYREHWTRWSNMSRGNAGQGGPVVDLYYIFTVPG